MTTLPPAAAFVSRPRYAPLEPRPCRSALMICDGPGSAALARLFATAPDLGPKAQVLHPGDAPALAGCGAVLVRLGNTAALDGAIDQALAGAAMGLQAFLAGSSGLIGQAQARLLAAGLPAGAIQAEHCGSPARRMQCVHCKTVAEDVTTDPYACPGCGRALFVRDHYSRRIGAFQGVCIDAETPGQVPPPVEIRP